MRRPAHVRSSRSTVKINRIRACWSWAGLQPAAALGVRVRGGRGLLGSGDGLRAGSTPVGRGVPGSEGAMKCLVCHGLEIVPQTVKEAIPVGEDLVLRVDRDPCLPNMWRAVLRSDDDVVSGAGGGGAEGRPRGAATGREASGVWLTSQEATADNRSTAGSPSSPVAATVGCNRGAQVWSSTATTTAVW